MKKDAPFKNPLDVPIDPHADISDQGTLNSGVVTV